MVLLQSLLWEGEGKKGKAGGWGTVSVCNSQHLIHYPPAPTELVFPNFIQNHLFMIHIFNMVILVNKYSGTICWARSNKTKYLCNMSQNPQDI